MGKARVLVVEDNVDSYELIRYLLKRSDCDAVWARSGREGVDMTRSDQPDLVLMDLSLPEMDGWTATEHIKSDPATRHIPVVALTAHNLPGDRKRAVDAGCDGYLSKPMKIPVFDRTIQEMLSKNAENPGKKPMVS